MRTSAVLWTLIAGIFPAASARGDNLAGNQALVQRLVFERAARG